MREEIKNNAKKSLGKKAPSFEIMDVTEAELVKGS